MGAVLSRTPPSEAVRRLPLGAILAGGQSRRFGAPKALATVAGVPLIEHVRATLARVIPDPVLITNQPELFAGLGLPSRPDAFPQAGPLAGLHAALCWALERERPGVLLVGCDQPFLNAGLLRHLVLLARQGGPAAVVPEGGGRFGVEPLCAWYSLEALPRVQARLSRGEGALAPLLTELETVRVPLAEVRRFGDPEVVFFNMNTRADRLRAERIARARKESDGES